LFAVTTNDRRIVLWDTVTREPVLPPFEGHTAGGVIARFSHAGDRLLSTDWNQLWRGWDTRTGRQLLTLPATGSRLQFSPADRLVGADWRYNPEVRFYRFRPGSELRTMIPRRGGGRAGFEAITALDSEGRLLAVATPADITLVDSARAEEVGVLPR